MKGGLATAPIAAFAIAMLYLTAPALAEVEGNCTMCHKYAGLGRIEKNKDDPQRKIKRIYYIDNDLFEASYHGKIRCRGCHTGIDKIPHTGAKQVDCATNCHIMDPSSNKAFSHRTIVDDFNKSAHGKDGSKHDYKDDLPVCKDCHSNKPYHAGMAEQIGARNFKKVCLQCHESESFVDRFYEHMIYRTSKRRPSKEVVRLCSTCHADQELMAKHDLEAVIGFSATFHAKAISYGNEKVANCLSCHAPYELGFSPHRIISHTDPSSPVSAENKIRTCRQSGCHTGANKEFASGSRVHPAPERIQTVAIDTTADTQAVQDQSDRVLDEDTAFQATIIGWIRLFYKMLIVAVIGGLALHRILDMYASGRHRRIGGH